MNAFWTRRVRPQNLLTLISHDLIRANRSRPRFLKNLSVNLSLMNLLDRSYRIHGSGVDAPGVSVYAAMNLTFD